MIMKCLNVPLRGLNYFDHFWFITEYKLGSHLLVGWSAGSISLSSKANFLQNIPYSKNEKHSLPIKT